MATIFMRHFRTHFLNDRISINISLNFIPYGPVENMSALVHSKPFSEPKMAQFTDAYMRL